MDPTVTMSRITNKTKHHKYVPVGKYLKGVWCCESGLSSVATACLVWRRNKKH